MKIFFLLSILLLTYRPAYAYLDAGSGSILMQILLGGLAGLAVVLKVFWHRILGIFGISKKTVENKDEQSSK
jgi:hypothetical protein